ncbi:MAG: outer membrane protein assembly factor BamB family protein, partial [Planctomycetota bacterium]
YLVHGLDSDRQKVRRAREHIQSLGIYGNVSVDMFDGRQLPYADNLVNLVVAEHPGEVSPAEIMRVLVPNGVAYVKRNGRWAKTVKKWPGEIDEWTHWLHGPDGNPVSQDSRVGPPRHLQWVARPLWLKHHNMTPSLSAMVTANGRVFYILDEALPGISGMPDKWSLFARDAFNGTLLWKRRIKQWGWSAWGPPSSRSTSRFDQPVDIARRLVAEGDYLYAATGFDAPLSRIDAATGRIVKTYYGSEGVSEVLYHNGRLIVSTHAKREGKTSSTPLGKKILLFDAETGDLLWKKEGLFGVVTKSGALQPFTTLFMVAGRDAIFFADRESVVCIEMENGRERWRQPRPAQAQIASSYFKSYIGNLSTLIAHEDVLLFSQIVAKKGYQKVLPWYDAMESRLIAFSVKTGRELWRYDGGAWDYDAPNSVFVIDDLVWTMTKDDYGLVALEPATGKVRKHFSAEQAMKTEHHHRCYGNKATANYILTARRGVEFLDIHSGENTLNHWTRGACRYGILPANGLLYVPPNPCICYQTAKVNGLLAFAAQQEMTQRQQPPARLEYGPAYRQIENRKLVLSEAEGSKIENPQDWPTYRHDGKRSGMIDLAMPMNLKQAWKTEIESWPRVEGVPPSNRGLEARDTIGLSSVTVSGGRVFVVSIDSHTLHALDRETGAQAWSYTLSARSDTPPTIYRGIVLLGCADGYVYALRARDGELIWRFRAAPSERRIVAFGQLESPWPVHGSVLVRDGVAFATAGRSSFLDGGIHVYALDPVTGELLQERTICSADPKTGKAVYSDKLRYDMPPDHPGALSDILVSDDSHIYMRHIKMDPANIKRDYEIEISQADRKLFYARKTQVGKIYSPGPQVASSAGLLDDSWFNQTYWTYANTSHCRLLVRDDRFTFGVSAYPGKPSRHSRSRFDAVKGKYRLFADDRQNGANRLWSREVPIRVTAMVATKNALFAAGTPHESDPDDPWAAYEGRRGGRLRVVSKESGQTLADHELESPPVWDGMAATNGRLYLATRSGSVLCLSGSQ